MAPLFRSKISHDPPLFLASPPPVINNEWSLSISYFTNIAVQNVNKAFVYITDWTAPLSALITNSATRFWCFGPPYFFHHPKCVMSTRLAWAWDTIISIIISHPLVFHGRSAIPNGFPCRIAPSMHARCCETFGKRKGECFFTLSESLATSRVHGWRYPARKTIWYSFNPTLLGVIKGFGWNTVKNDSVTSVQKLFFYWTIWIWGIIFPDILC